MATTPERKLFSAELQRMRLRGRDSDDASAPGNAQVLRAIEGLKDDIRGLERLLRPEEDDQPEPVEVVPLEAVQQQQAEVTMLKTELRALSVCIQQTKLEIAALRPSQEDDDRLIAVTFELDAIVTATESATDNILEAAEKIDGLARGIQAQEQDSYIRHLADEITEHVVGIFESCNFQDITGQRITKIVNTLKYVEDRVNAMIDIWGAEGFSDLVAPEADEQKDDEAKLLNGPQLENKGISQDEIDKLFG